MQDVRQQQFLVLLLVIHSSSIRCSASSRRFALQQPLNPLVHMRPIAQNLVQRRAAKTKSAAASPGNCEKLS